MHKSRTANERWMRSGSVWGLRKTAQAYTRQQSAHKRVMGSGPRFCDSYFVVQEWKGVPENVATPEVVEFYGRDSTAEDAEGPRAATERLHSKLPTFCFSVTPGFRHSILRFVFRWVRTGRVSLRISLPRRWSNFLEEIQPQRTQRYAEGPRAATERLHSKPPNFLFLWKGFTDDTSRECHIILE